jgi:hypothetical protein
MLTVEGVRLEAKPATNEEAITKLKEARFFSEKLTRLAESISDIANNTSLDDRKFHSTVRRMVLDAGASGGFLCFSAKANMHLDKSESEITENHLKEIKMARTYAMNKSAYSRDVQDSYSREIEGLLKKSESTAKLLQLRRISVAALAAMSSQGWSVVRITGTDVVFIDTPVALKVTPMPVEPDVVAAFEKRLRQIEEKLDNVEVTLGRADRMDVNTKYNAESPGFVVAVTGDNYYSMWIDVDGKGLARVQQQVDFHTLMTPVPRGSTWMVGAKNKDGSETKLGNGGVYWIPLKISK